MAETSANETPQQSAEPAAPDLRHLYAVTAAVCAVGVLAFIAFVYVYGNYGAGLVNRLSGQIGEVVAAQAKSLATSGETEAAIERYRRAFATRFDDPRQRAWALRSYADLLLQDEQPDDAIAALEECMTIAPDDDIALGTLCRAYRAVGRNEDMLAASQRWVELETRLERPTALANARLHEGNALELLSRKDEAVQAYVAGAKADPRNDCAYQAALLLHQAGQDDQALALLEPYLANATGPRAQSATNLRNQIAPR